MKKSLIMISIATVLVMIITYFVGGMELVLNGLEKSKNTAISSALMLIASFIVIGQLQVLLTKDLMDKWLKRSRNKGNIYKRHCWRAFSWRTLYLLPFYFELFTNRFAFLHIHFVHLWKTNL